MVAMRWAAAVRVRSSAFGHRWLYTFNVIGAEEWPKACCDRMKSCLAALSTPVT